MLGTLTLTRTEVVSNLAVEGGGVYVSSTGTLTATDTEWGVAGTENQPDDVAGGAFSIGYFQSNETFTCSPTGC